MYKIAIEKTCECCGKTFLTRQAKTKACSKICAKKLWKNKVLKLGHNLTSSVGRKKGSIPWNKNITCLQLAGKNNGFFGKHHTEETKAKIQKSIQITKKANNSFNMSFQEEEVYSILLTRFSTIVRQYSSSKYPFACDFYVKDLDLYIECNFHWTHGIYTRRICAPYDKNNPEHKKLLELWKSKNTKYFNEAIKTWTVRDPLKLKTAIKNHLNYLIFYTLDEFKSWFNSL